MLTRLQGQGRGLSFKAKAKNKAKDFGLKAKAGPNIPKILVKGTTQHWDFSCLTAQTYASELPAVSTLHIYCTVGLKNDLTCVAQRTLWLLSTRIAGYSHSNKHWCHFGSQS